MRIWFAASVSSPYYGSIYRSQMSLSAELGRYGHFTEVFYSDKRTYRNRLRFSFFLALRLLVRFWHRPNWIIADSFDGFLCLTVIRIFRMKTKVALHNHGWGVRIAEQEKRLPASLINNPTTWQTRLIGFVLLHNVLDKASLCICGTIDETRWMCRRYPQVRSKITVVPNGVPALQTPFWPDQEEYPPSFLMVGEFTWSRNLEYGVEIFRRFLEIEPAARLFIVGCGTLSEKKKSLLFQLGDSVFTVESEAPDKMWRWYESCPMLLFPSRYEGGRPFAILEAQSRGCIVFASDIPAVRECVISARTGYIFSGVNPVADVKIIRTVYQNREIMRSVGIAAWKKALRNSSQRQGKRCARILLMKMIGKKQ